MIYTALTKKAMAIAYEAHHGQVDQCGTPYIFHPYHLAEQMSDELSCCVALLHDVAEDSSVSPEALARLFPPSVIEALRLLTYETGTDYLDYIRALGHHPLARTVKLADLAHNMDLSRFAGQSIPEKLNQKQALYQTANAILTAMAKEEK